MRVAGRIAKVRLIFAVHCAKLLSVIGSSFAPFRQGVTRLCAYRWVLISRFLFPRWPAPWVRGLAIAVAVASAPAQLLPFRRPAMPLPSR
jgi:hypothetical protein